MEAKLDSATLLTRAAGTAFGLGTQALFGATVCALFLFLRDGSSRVVANWLAMDCLLALQFAIVHSVLLLPSVRSIISRSLPGSLYGCVFNATTCVGLWLVFRYWRASSVVVWDATGSARLSISTGFYASWIALYYSLRLSGLGYQTGWTQWLYWWRRQPLPRRGFVQRGAYRWLRHPVYLSFLGLIWFTPRMTADHVVLTGVWTAYVFVGSCLKDRRLAFYLGDAYREYASRVPGYPGFFFGPLGKWPPLESTPRSAAVVVRREAGAAA
jgi:protein-S-isoprenylcysteine O-methyltransferase Ste14